MNREDMGLVAQAERGQRVVDEVWELVQALSNHLQHTGLRDDTWLP